MSPQKGDVKGLVVPDLSKAQNANEFLILCFLLNFFQFFSKKLWLMSNIQIWAGKRGKGFMITANSVAAYGALNNEFHR